MLRLFRFDTDPGDDLRALWFIGGGTGAPLPVSPHVGRQQILVMLGIGDESNEVVVFTSSSF